MPNGRPHFRTNSASTAISFEVAQPVFATTSQRTAVRAPYSFFFKGTKDCCAILTEMSSLAKRKLSIGFCDSAYELQPFGTIFVSVIVNAA